MLTFAAFLEGIADKIGPYTGDPVQAMASRDIADEEGLGAADIHQYYIRPMIAAIERMFESMRGQVSTGTANNFYQEIDAIYEQLKRVPGDGDGASAAERFRGVLSKWRRAFNIWQHMRSGQINRPFADSMSPHVTEIVGILKGLSRRAVKDTFASRGVDYQMTKILQKLTYAHLGYHDREAVAYLNQLGEVEVVRRFLSGIDLGGRRGTANLMGLTMSNMAFNITSNYNEQPDIWDLFVKLLHSERFASIMPQEVQRSIKLFRTHYARMQQGYPVR